MHKDKNAPSLEVWERESIARWEELKTGGGFPQHPGVWIGSYSVAKGVASTITLDDLNKTLIELKPPCRSPFSGGTHEIVNRAVECLYTPKDQSRAEFWRASKDGMIFGVQAYQEDLTVRSSGSLRPGEHLSICCIDRHAGGFLAHAARFAQVVTEGRAQAVLMRMQWRRLQGRKLSKWGCEGDQTFDEPVEVYRYKGRPVLKLWGEASDRIEIKKIISDLGGVVFQGTEALYTAFEPSGDLGIFQDRPQAYKNVQPWQEWLSAERSQRE